MKDIYYYLEKYATLIAIIISSFKSLILFRKPTNIYDNIWFGGYKDAILHGHKFDHVINLTGGKIWNTTHHIPMKDNRTIESEDKMKEAFSIVNSLEGQILIHCADGRNRSGTLVSIIKAKNDNMPIDEVIDEFKEKNLINPNKGLIQTAKNLIKKL